MIWMIISVPISIIIILSWGAEPRVWGGGQGGELPGFADNQNYHNYPNDYLHDYPLNYPIIYENGDNDVADI